MSSDAHGAEAILKKHAGDFYSSLVEEYPEGFPITFPLPNDKKLYWEDKLRSKYSEVYPLYCFSELDAFTFFVGLEVQDTEEENVRASLGNLKACIDFLAEARDSDQYDDASEQMLHLLNIAREIQKNYRLAGSILIAQLYNAWVQEHKENLVLAKTYAHQAESALTEATMYGYADEAYRAYVKYEPRLSIDKYAILKGLVNLGLLEADGKDGSHVVLTTLDVNKF